MLVPVLRKPVLYVLLMIDAMFVVLHLLSQVFTLIPADDFVNLNREMNAPTWFQQSQLVAAAGLCLLVAALGRRGTGGEHRHWLALGVGFVLLSLDEGTASHERLIGPMRVAFDIEGGPFLSAWVIPALLGVAVLALVFIPFWHRLPSEPRRLFLVAAAMFVLGALGLEMVAGEYETRNGIDEVWWFLVACEEGLEMAGATVFIFSLLSMLQLRQPADGVAFRVEDG